MLSCLKLPRFFRIFERDSTRRNLEQVDQTSNFEISVAPEKWVNFIYTYSLITSQRCQKFAEYSRWRKYKINRKLTIRYVCEQMQKRNNACTFLSLINVPAKAKKAWKLTINHSSVILLLFLVFLVRLFTSFFHHRSRHE